MWTFLGFGRMSGSDCCDDVMWSSILGIMTATPAMLQNQDRFHHHCDIKDNFYVLVVNTHRGETCLLFRPNPSQQLCRLPRRQFLWRPATLAAPTVYAAQAPVVEYIAPAPAVSYAAQAPVVEYIAPAPGVICRTSARGRVHRSSTSCVLCPTGAHR